MDSFLQRSLHLNNQSTNFPFSCLFNRNWINNFILAKVWRRFATFFVRGADQFFFARYRSGLTLKASAPFSIPSLAPPELLWRSTFTSSCPKSWDVRLSTWMLSSASELRGEGIQALSNDPNLSSLVCQHSTGVGFSLASKTAFLSNPRKLQRRKCRVAQRRLKKFLPLPSAPPLQAKRQLMRKLEPQQLFGAPLVTQSSTTNLLARSLE